MPLSITKCLVPREGLHQQLAALMMKQLSMVASHLRLLQGLLLLQSLYCAPSSQMLGVANLVQVLLNLSQQETLALASRSVSHTLMQPWAVHLGSNSLNGYMDFAAHVNCAQRRCSNNSKFEVLAGGCFFGIPIKGINSDSNN